MVTSMDIHIHGKPVYIASLVKLEHQQKIPSKRRVNKNTPRARLVMDF